MWKKPDVATADATAPDSSIDAAPSSRKRNPGRRFTQIVKLKPEFVSQYKEAHAAVWPQVLKQIKDCNIQDCRFSIAYSFFWFPSWFKTTTRYQRPEMGGVKCSVEEEMVNVGKEKKKKGAAK